VAGDGRETPEVVALWVIAHSDRDKIAINKTVSRNRRKKRARTGGRGPIWRWKGFVEMNSTHSGLFPPKGAA
jgi:hypothetical protein